MCTQLEIVQYLISKKACVEFVSQGGFTALYWACHRGFKAVVEALIEAGAKHQVGERSKRRNGGGMYMA